jgi:hypothetical protein
MTPGDATAASELRATCEVRDWPVFVHGYHKGDLYPPADLERMERNFQLLSADGAEFRGEDGGPYLTANVKLGHDRQQRAKKSLGFINLGQAYHLERGGPNGTARLWLRNVPTEIGAKINAGQINGGSIEIVPSIPNPQDPGQTIDGPVMTGVALLGEEQPAVKGMGRPRAVFADGTPVPPDHEVSDWLSALAGAANEPDEPDEVLIGGHSYAAHRLLFSERVMNPEMQAKLQALGLTPEQIQGVLDCCGGQMNAPAPAPPPGQPGGAMSEGIKESPDVPVVPAGQGTGPNPGKEMSDDASKDMPPWAQKMAEQFGQQFAALTKRMGDLEAAKTDEQKKADEAKMAAFSALVEPRLTGLARKVTPHILDAVIRPAVEDIKKARTFSTEADRVKAFSDFVGRYEALPDDPRLKQTSVADKQTGAVLSENGRGLLTALKVTSPRVYEKHTRPLPAAK